MIDELHSTGTNTGPKTGVVRVTYKRTPDEVSNSKPKLSGTQWGCTISHG